MKKLYHLCFTSHKEVMFRDSQDVGMMLNLLALDSWKYKVEILADAEMSTHVHLIVNSGQASDFVRSVRQRYSKYFNGKYHRPAHMRLGEKGYFALEVEGNCHMQTAMGYVLRNPWHHGVTGTVFEYPFSSAGDMFPLAFGKRNQPRIGIPKKQTVRMKTNGQWVKTLKSNTVTHNDKNIWCPEDFELITSKDEMAKFLPRYSEWPDEWMMDKNHVFLRPCYMELKQAENLFVSASAFEYAMFRKTDARMIEEQKNDGVKMGPVTLTDIEPDTDKERYDHFLSNEKSGTFKSVNTDFDVCETIDLDIVPKFACRTVYELDEMQMRTAGQILYHELHISQKQIDRCLPFFLFK